jgi:hypothetical protein
MTAARFEEITNLASGKTPQLLAWCAEVAAVRDPLAGMRAVSKRTRLLSGRQK